MRHLTRRRFVEGTMLATTASAMTSPRTLFGGENRSVSPGRQDMRRILDDASVEAVLIATPDHWHTRRRLGDTGGKDAFSG
jgi:hypothetical protein